MFDRVSFSQEVRRANSDVWITLIDKSRWLDWPKDGDLFVANSTLIMGTITGLLQEFLSTGDRDPDDARRSPPWSTSFHRAHPRRCAHSRTIRHDGCPSTQGLACADRPCRGAGALQKRSDQPARAGPALPRGSAAISQRTACCLWRYRAFHRSFGWPSASSSCGPSTSSVCSPPRTWLSAWLPSFLLTPNAAP